MASYLICWKPASESKERGWPEEELAALAARVRASGEATEPWRFARQKGVRVGERVFLLRQGRRGKAILGYGSIADLPKAASDRTGVAFEVLLEPSSGKVLATGPELDAISRERGVWDTQASGIVLPDAVAADLEALVIDRPVVDDVKASAGAPNPDWTRDELILALDLYFREPSARGSKAHRECIRLSEILNALPIHAKASHGTTFRNPNGVAMKLSNFLKYDPSYSGKGLSAGSQAEQEVWDTFASDHAKLRGTADAILAAAEFLKGEGISSGDDGDDEGAEEGRILYKLHRYRERAGSLPSKKKKAAMRERGALECEACGFDFAETYGDRGQGYAECHHGRPLSKLIPGEKTRLADLHIVCANCHRMIHFGKRWLTVAEVKALRSSPSAPHSKEH